MQGFLRRKFQGASLPHELIELESHLERVGLGREKPELLFLSLRE